MTETPSPAGGALVSRRVLFAGGAALALALLYALRGVLVPLFLAFLLAYALDPIVDRLERLKVPRSLAAPLVMVTLLGLLLTVLFFGVPLAIAEFRRASERLPEQLDALRLRAEAMLDEQFHYRPPATWGELYAKYGTELREHMPDASRIGGAILGSVSAIFVLLGTLIVPVFALYLLGDFDHIVARAALLVPRRWMPSVSSVVLEIHVALGKYVRGQILTNVVLAVLYATGLSLTGIRLAIPIGVLTGMLAFIPYVGLVTGTLLAVVMALLDWHSSAQLLGVVAVMATVGLLDSMLITPRIVGGSVGLKPLEVLLTMAAAATLFGFLGVLLAVPLGAVIKILLSHAARAYLASDFYRRGAPADALPAAAAASESAEAVEPNTG